MDKVKQFFPFLAWFPMDGATIRADLVAGITVALVLIPQSMAYAQLAGLPAYFGLYASFLPVMVAALWGSSKQLGTGPVAVVSLLTAVAVGAALQSQLPKIGVSSIDAMTQEQLIEFYVPLAVLLALLVGLFQLTLGVLKLGVVVNFLSHPVIVGFTNAAAMVIGLSQLNKIFGVSKERSDFFLGDIWGVLQQIGATHWETLVMGVLAFVIMMGTKKYLPKLPGVLMAVAVTTLLSWGLDFQGMGGAVVGSIPEGLPTIKVPTINLEVLGILFTSAIVISMVGFMEAISIAKAMAAKTKDKVDPNQELIGQGLGNIVGSFSQAYPASGSFSRSAVNLNAGAKTGMSSVYTAALVVITLLFLTPLLYHLPKAVLAAVIMMAVIGLINFKAFKHAWIANKHDGVASVVTFVATLGFAPHLDKGIMIGALLALGLYLYSTMKPRVAILGRYADGTLRDIRVHDLPQDNRIVVLRFDGSLYFANVSYFEEAVLEALCARPDVKYFLVVGDAINSLDASGEEMLHQLVSRLKDNGVTLVFSGLKRQIHGVMQRTGLFGHIGAENIHPDEDMAIDYIYHRLDGDEFDERYCLLLTPEATPRNSAYRDALEETF
ncbi:MAG TPA: sulfate permease [Gammaproteobacteria bacterium]|jgi:SulP family sulfate permease|nr:sulfate permease [Gammaproteobacteria bacterium]MBT6556026.1 sulfate permease [Candidatus Neomarinimicrobiota bacterium]MBT3489424.1 sulfate permease [Gammaproteobacteria bacterium]MBT3719941.1 sulfate permease [Gammaproteobacteria bacterium]MBT3844178.1 sulfate permease [Gammaproteobacteria bacterium]